MSRLRTMGRTIAKLALWGLTILAALWMFDAGLDKFRSAAGWSHWFYEVWGYPAGSRVVVGVVEIGGAALLLWPRTASYSAAVLGTVMGGAVWTLMTKPADLSVADPAFGILMLLVIFIGHWQSRVPLPRVRGDTPVSGRPQTRREEPDVDT